MHADTSWEGKLKPTVTVICMRFSALGAGYLQSIRTVIGSKRSLNLVRLVKVIILVLILRHSIENHLIKYSHRIKRALKISS